MKNLYFCRHGLSQLNLEGRWAGSTETPLTDEGRAQAEAAGEKANELGIDYILCSPLSRAHETARIIARKIGYPEDQIDVNSLVVERHFGELEGEPWQPDLDLDGFADIETMDTIKERAKLTLEHLGTIDADNILVVSHGQFGRVLRHMVHPELPIKGSPRFGNAEIVQLYGGGTGRPTINRIAELQQFIADFAKVERVPQLADTGRPENDVEHSYGLALTCWFLAPKIAPDLDLGKILRYALAHDTVEIHAGDTFIFADPEVLASKSDREDAALEKLAEDWSDFPGMTDYAKGYKDKRDEEAKFVYSVDKILPVLMVDLGEGSDFWKRHKITFDMEADKKQNIRTSAAVAPYYDALLDWMRDNSEFYSEA